MTILTTTKYRTIDPSTGDLDISTRHIRPSVEVDTRVTLSCTEQIAGHRVLLNLIQGTRYTQRTTRHVHRTATQHVGLLVTAIDTRQDMPALDIYRSITSYDTSRTQPHTVRIAVCIHRLTYLISFCLIYFPSSSV